MATSQTIVLTYRSRSLVILRPRTYAEALSEARIVFSLASDAEFLLRTTVGSTEACDVSEEAWSTPILWENGKAFRVAAGKPFLRTAPRGPAPSSSAQKHLREDNAAESAPSKCARYSNPSSSSTAQLAHDGPAVGPLPATIEYCSLVIRSAAGEEDNLVKVKITTPFSKIYTAVARQRGIRESHFKLIWEGEALWPDDTPEIVGIKGEEIIDFRSIQVGGKPVVYLFPPSALASVQVDLTLVPEWTFSALYPLSDITRGKDGSSTTSWTVAASPDGTLVDKASSLSLSYLFWEAHAPSLPPSPPLLPSESPSTRSLNIFNPGRPSLDRSNAALLPFTSFLSHLDKALTALSLHTSARNDFITYWLPSFVRIHERGQQIAFRFLAQAAYEQAASLEVEPRPDVVTRVFLLFKGVDAVESERWRKVEDVDWVKEVGVEEGKVRDEELFRVLEWGGMEVVGC